MTRAPDHNEAERATRADRDRRKATRRLRGTVVLVAAFAVGLGAVVVPRWLDDPPATPRFRVDAQHSVTRLRLPDAHAQALGLEEFDRRIRATPVAVAAAPKVPRATIDAFLAALVGDDATTSYSLLTSSVRAHVANVGAWQQAQARAPHVTAFRVVGEHAGIGIANYDVELTTTPTLDPTLGLVTGAAHATFVVRGERDGFRVDADASRIRPTYAPETRIGPDAQAWISARHACGADGRALLGARASRLRAWCDTVPVLQFGAVTTAADRDDVRDLVAAYGPDALTWARVIHVSAPESLDLLLAPFADHWVVVGAYPASGHSG